MIIHLILDDFYFYFSTSQSPESGICTSSMSLPSSSSGSNDKQQVGDDDDDDEDEEFYDTDPLPIIGRCRAMYPFEGKGLWICFQPVHIGSSLGIAYKNLDLGVNFFWQESK